MLRLVKPTDQGTPTESGQEERIVLTGLEAAGGSVRVCICTGFQNGDVFFLRADAITDLWGGRLAAHCPRCNVVHAVIGFLKAAQEDRLDLEDGAYCIPPALLLASR